MTIGTITMFITGMTLLNRARKHVEQCHLDHLRSDLAISKLCQRHGDLARRTLVYGAYISTLGAVATWSVSGLTSAIQIAASVWIITGFICMIIDIMLDVRIGLHAKASGVHT